MIAFQHKTTEGFLWGVIGGIFAGALLMQWLHGQTPWVLFIIWIIALVGTFYEVRKIDSENVAYDDELTYKYLDLLDEQQRLEARRRKTTLAGLARVAPKVEKQMQQNSLFRNLENQFPEKPSLEQ